jgi:hypothetical protein
MHRLPRAMWSLASIPFAWGQRRHKGGGAVGDRAVGPVRMANSVRDATVLDAARKLAVGLVSVQHARRQRAVGFAGRGTLGHGRAEQAQNTLQWRKK